MVSVNEWVPTCVHVCWSRVPPLTKSEREREVLPTSSPTSSQKGQALG